MGIAYLSKSYLAFITLGVAFVVWFVAWVKRWKHVKNAATDNFDMVEQQESDHSITDGEDTQIRLSDVGLQLLAGILTVAPWAIYCLIKISTGNLYGNINGLLTILIRMLKIGLHRGTDHCLNICSYSIRFSMPHSLRLCCVCWS